MKNSSKKVNSRFDFTIDEKTGKEKGCEYENKTWCNLPKYKRCKNCLRCVDGSKACEITAF
jgi:hypothetical protein